MQKILDSDEKDCLIQALRSHVDFLEVAIAARTNVGAAASIMAAGLGRLGQGAKALKASIESASVISLELPDA